jgi:2-keto-3-deoxy-L-rhamnonate aldolase RhmA
LRHNRLRQLLNENKSSLGIRIINSWPAVTELIGHSGAFDYVEFDGEYAPYDLFSLENLGRAIDLFPHLSGMMKVEQEPRTYVAIRSIGSGIQNVLFADPRTKADVEECVRAVRAESPATGGIHGVGMRRDVGYLLEVGTPAFVQALEDAVVAIMIEKKQAVENLEELLSVPGVDMVQFGAWDYAMSIGKPGQHDHPEVRETERHIIETALAKGIHPRAETNSPEDISRYMDMGVKHFVVGSEMFFMYQWFTTQGKDIRKQIGADTIDNDRESSGYQR